MFAAQGPEVYQKVFERDEDEQLPNGTNVYQPESQAEFDAMIRQMQAEGMLGD